MLKNKIIFIN